MLYLAPMEDVTDPAFRLLCKRFGADRVYTEFVNADALVRDVASTVRKLHISDAERPVAIQIYGKDPVAMADAAQIVEQAKPDFIDINFGCPVKKVAGKCAGAGMLQNIPLLLDITREVVKAVNLPVTVKTRLGWSADNIIIPTLAEQLQDQFLFPRRAGQKTHRGGVILRRVQVAHGADHLRVGAVAPLLKAQKAEGPVRHPGQGRKAEAGHAFIPLGNSAMRQGALA